MSDGWSFNETEGDVYDEERPIESHNPFASCNNLGLELDAEHPVQTEKNVNVNSSTGVPTNEEIFVSSTTNPNSDSARNPFDEEDSHSHGRSSPDVDGVNVNVNDEEEVNDLIYGQPSPILRNDVNSNNNNNGGNGAMSWVEDDCQQLQEEQYHIGANANASSGHPQRQFHRHGSKKMKKKKNPLMHRMRSYCRPPQIRTLPWIRACA